MICISGSQYLEGIKHVWATTHSNINKYLTNKKKVPRSERKVRDPKDGRYQLRNTDLPFMLFLVELKAIAIECPINLFKSKSIYH